MRHRLLLPKLLLCWLLLARGASAQTAATPEAAAPTRAIKVGLCAQWLPSNPFGGSSAAGPGIIGVYEFLLSPRFSLGIEGGYRQYFGGAAVNQLVYGLVLKHGFLEPASAVRPYLQYGLLQQISRQNGHQGASVSYDAGLMAGADFRAFVPLFLEVAFHVSHLSAIDAQARSVSYFEVVSGTRWSW